MSTHIPEKSSEFLYSPRNLGYTHGMNTKKANGAKGLYVEIDEALLADFVAAVKLRGHTRKWVVEKLLRGWVGETAPKEVEAEKPKGKK